MATSRRGQAFIELALGMFALALTFAALFGFAAYIIAALNMGRDLRAEAGAEAKATVGGDGAFAGAADAETVELEPMAAEYVFGSEEVAVKEAVYLPVMGIDNAL